MLYLLLFFQFITAAKELTTGEDGGEKPYIEVEEERWQPDRWVRQIVTVRKECKPGECGVLRAPVVEGQKLVYIYPAKQKDYVQLHQPVKTFFKHWAKSCWEKEVLNIWFKDFEVRDNKVASFTGSIEMLSQSKYREKWNLFLKEYDPKILLFLLQTPVKTYSVKEWKKLFSNIPKYLGCVLIAPPTQYKNIGLRRHFKNMQEAISAVGGNCQFVRADEEMLSLAEVDKGKIFLSNGQLTASGKEEWWRRSKIQLCETEPMRDVSGSKGNSQLSPSVRD